MSDSVLASALLTPVSECAAPARPSSLLRRLLVGVDAAAASLGWAVGVLATDALHLGGAPRPISGHLSVVVLLAAVTIAAVAWQKLYLARICTVRAMEIVRLGRAAAVATVTALLVPRALPISLDADGAVLGGFLSLVLLVFGRGVYRTWLQTRRRNGGFVRPIVIVGSNDEADELAHLITDHPELGYRIAGFIGPDGVLGAAPEVPRLGGVRDAARLIASTNASGVVIASTALGDRERNALIRRLLRAGVHVHLTSGIWGIDHRRLLIQPLAHEPLFYIEPTHLASWHLAMKRVIDVSTVLAASVVALPVLLLAAIAIKLQDRGPVVFKQQRIGRNGKPFTMYKLRTMVPNAERLIADLGDLVARDGPSLKLVNDPRRTTIGRFLERTSIDELPQILNVLKGEMSIVGPRPALVKDAELFDEELRERHAVRPGITGLWQIEARDNPHFSAYRRYDLFYIENWSVSLDLAIMLATIQRVVWRSIELIAGRRAEMAAARPPLSVVAAD